MLTAPSRVVQTWFLTSPRTGDRYVIELSPYSGTGSPRTVLHTTDAQWYEDALDAEGRDVWFVARFHLEGRTQILDELIPAAAAAPPIGGPP